VSGGDARDLREEPARIGAAYDQVADDYDRQLERDQWIRRVLWRHFGRLFHAGDHVLDAGCGTGADTLHLASRQVRVTAVDVSPRMLAALRAKLDGAPFASLVDVRQGDLNELGPTLPRRLDGIVSSFAALNTVDLAKFGAMAASLLRPGGRLVCHMLSPGYLRRGMRAVRSATPSEETGREATPGSARSAIHLTTNIGVGGEPLRHLVSTPQAVYSRFFSSELVLRRSYALGLVALPRRARSLPAPWLDALGRIESVVGALPGLASLGRFFVLDLERPTHGGPWDATAPPSSG
jgi:SAM-dependent methyltransferase